jgi:hypothetical protein
MDTDMLPTERQKERLINRIPSLTSMAGYNKKQIKER